MTYLNYGFFQVTVYINSCKSVSLSAININHLTLYPDATTSQEEQHKT